jgi:hypothetical protein
MDPSAMINSHQNYNGSQDIAWALDLREQPSASILARKFPPENGARQPRALKLCRRTSKEFGIHQHGGIL